MGAFGGERCFYICSSITFSQMLRCVDCGGRNRLSEGCDVNGLEDPCSRRSGNVELGVTRIQGNFKQGLDQGIPVFG